MIPAATRGDIFIHPLGNKYNRNHMPLDANGEEPVKQDWFNGADVVTVPINPSVHHEATIDPRQAAKPRELDIAKFFRGGSVDG